MKHSYSTCGLKHAALVLLLCASSAFVSCGGSSRDEISASRLKSQLNDRLEIEGEDSHYTSVKVGFYEENSEAERYKLRQLAAAGVLTYEVQRMDAKVSVKTGYDWWSGRSIYKQVNRKVCFVNVTLTDAGRKCILPVLPEPVEEEDRDLINPNDEYYPEFDVPEKETFSEPKTEQNPEPVSTPDPEVEQPETEPEAEAPAPDAKPKSEYEQAKERENPMTFNVSTYKMRVTKVRNIRILDGEARFEAIVERYDVTPFGRVLDRVYEGDKTLVRCSAVYYEDKGWKVED